MDHGLLECNDRVQLEPKLRLVLPLQRHSRAPGTRSESRRSRGGHIVSRFHRHVWFPEQRARAAAVLPSQAAALTDQLHAREHLGERPACLRARDAVQLRCERAGTMADRCARLRVVRLHQLLPR